MILGFDTSQIGNGSTGCGFYAERILRGLSVESRNMQITAFSDFGDFWYQDSDRENRLVKTYGIHEEVRQTSRRSCKNFWNHKDLPHKLKKFDLVHSNNFWCPTQTVNFRLIYTLYDLGFLDNPEWTTELNRVGCFEGVFNSSLHADFIIAISEFSRKKYMQYFPYYPPERIRVVYPSCRFENFNANGIKFPLPEGYKKSPFWLNVSTIEPRKNQILLIRAYQVYLKKSKYSLPLILAGSPGWLMEDFPQYIQRHDLQQKVLIAGYVNNDELCWLYQNCFGTLYPALYEGFGLPVLESMYFGKPSLCSKTTSLPEVAGNGAILLDPCDAGGWAEKMILLEENDQFKSNLIERGLKQASKFTLKQSAKACLNVYEDALSMPKKI